MKNYNPVFVINPELKAVTIGVGQTCTGDKDTDKITLNTHGFSDGWQVSFSAIGTITGISVNTAYYVVSSTTNDFKISLTSGGGAIDLTGTTSAAMTVHLVNQLRTGVGYMAELCRAPSASRSVTFTDTGDLVTLANHGLIDGTPVLFTSITDTTGISVETSYYVVNARINTFQVAATLGGNALALSTNGTGTIYSEYLARDIKISQIFEKALQATTAGLILIFITDTNGTNPKLFDEILTVAVPSPSTSAKTDSVANTYLDLNLKSGQIVYVVQTLTQGFNVYCYYGELDTLSYGIN